MIYRVRHTTQYEYGTEVQLAAHMLHLRPRPLPGQRVLTDRLVFDPKPTRRRDGWDHFGNATTWLSMDTAHSTFEVTAESTVDASFPLPPAPDGTACWQSVVQAARTGGADSWEAAEFAFGSAMAPAHEGAGLYAASSFPLGRPILEGLLELNGRICRDFRFRTGVTTISTPIDRILARREGVCQDFTHLMLGGLRALGLPARYVSGYIRTHPLPGTIRRRGADQSHAWVGCWLGPRHGWVGLDPTNDLVVHAEHVVLGWGRDYGDVSPVLGILLGGGVQELSVSVDLEPLDAE
jgi:transglutaminase-like putative cysteine protease